MVERGQERVLSTLNVDGSRRWLKPRPASGRWHDRRRVFGWFLIALFVLMPHARIAGRPPLLLDVINRELTFFGQTLYPTDTFLLAFLLISTALSVFFFTAMFGRVWCGWACPQTVYLELLYRPVERLFDGTPGRKRAGPLARVRFLKYPVYVVISLLLAHTFLSYFVGTDALRTWIFGSPLDHPLSFALVVAVTGAMMFDFAFFREQMCIVACPYGRLQSVMLDKDSLVVGYDRRRGEPRGRKRRKPKRVGVDLTVGETDPDPVSEPEPGDCVDCGMCVTTCPTGIDIREGLQLECVNCTQCIDACDSVMTKLGRPTGLIRYDSQRSLEGGGRRLARARLFVYPSVIAAMLTVFTVLLVRREPVYVSVVRGPGLPYTVSDDAGAVTNSLRVKLHDRTRAGGTYRVSVVGVEGGVIGVEAMTLEPGEIRSQPAMITLPRGVFVDGRADVMLRVENADGSVVVDAPCLVLGPRRRVVETPAETPGERTGQSLNAEGSSVEKEGSL
ncbi:MAG: cytochrome c oxidase accessory protein CcoG [Planctomycetota bacterium]